MDGGKDCPLCQLNDWQVGELVTFSKFLGGSVVIGGKMMPAVPLVCKACGYTMFFNPVVTGLLGSDEDDERVLWQYC